MYVLRLGNDKVEFEHKPELLRLNKILNISQLIIRNNVNFIYMTELKSFPYLFRQKFQKPLHKYSTRLPRKN